MSLQTFLDDMNTVLEKDKNMLSYDSIKELFFEDILVERYKEKHYELIIDFEKQSGGNNKNTNMSYDEFIKLSDDEIYHKKIDEIIIITSIIKNRNIKIIDFSKFYDKMILSHIIHNPKKYDTYILDFNYFIKIPNYFELNRSNVYINKLTDIKSDNILINLNVTFNQMNQNIEKIMDYIDNIINANLTHNGTLILTCHLLLNNKQYYEYLTKLFSKFSKIYISFVLIPLRTSMICDIKFKKYNNKFNNRIDYNKLLGFFKLINQFILDEVDIALNLEKIKYSDKFMFKLITNKLFQQ